MEKLGEKDQILDVMPSFYITKAVTVVKFIVTKCARRKQEMVNDYCYDDYYCYLPH